MLKPIISIISPCFNELLVLNETSLQLNAILQDLINRDIISVKSFIDFIDDGSQVNSWNIIEGNSKKIS